MSQTLTLPVTSTEIHHIDHNRRGSRGFPRNSRLGPPYPLPRIPSGDVAPTPSIAHQDELAADKKFHHRSDSATSLYQDSVTYQHMRKPSSLSSIDSCGMRTEMGDLEPLQRGPEKTFEVVTSTGYHGHKHDHPVRGRSHTVSDLAAPLLQATEQIPLINSILASSQSRPIFLFMLLNLAFMFIQATYGYLTGSLGLISDSIHMFFDCLGLFLGLCAAVMSKWPSSTRFPYGYGKINTLAGLGNGIFLMLISFEIVYEAVERLWTGSQIQRTTELLVVSSLGLAVNLVGIACFHEHHHHGGSCNHSHSHNPGTHEKDELKTSDADFVTTPVVSDKSAHSHGQTENMRGIYLHILADAMGSVSVIISTLLIKWNGWSGWDPLASCLIAVLIFMSVWDLVISTCGKLLLSLDHDIEYNLRDVLGGLTDIRGVVGYTVPKFWLEDAKEESGHHHHHHDHEASHTHDHSGTHNTPHHDHRTVQEMHAHDDATKILGSIHIQISSSVDLADLQTRVRTYFRSRNMDLIIQYEREGEHKCWCSAPGTRLNHKRTPTSAKSMSGWQTPVTGNYNGSISGFLEDSAGAGLNHGQPGNRHAVRKKSSLGISESMSKTH